MVFINFTNHPSSTWTSEQICAATKYGSIIDIQFPNVNPSVTELDIEKIGNNAVEKIESLKPTVVLCQGEFCLSYYVIKELQDRGILVLNACSERRVTKEVNADSQTIKTSCYQFVKFRKYHRS